MGDCENQEFKIIVEHAREHTTDDVRSWIRQVLSDKVDSYEGFAAEIFGGSMEKNMVIGRLAINHSQRIDTETMSNYLNTANHNIKITGVRKIEF